MTPAQRPYNKLIGRFLLFAGYIFLLGTQFNYRYYNAANFFDYRGGHVVKSVSRQSHVEAQTVDVQQRHAHLRLDKRFRFRAIITHDFAVLVVSPEYSLYREKNTSPLRVYSQTDLPSNALRGPPSAC